MMQIRFGNTYGQYLHRQEAFFMRKMIAADTAPVLSLGCGTGRLMEMASHGADISAAMIDEAARKYPGKYFAVCNAANTAYPDGYFKNIFSLHVLMHLPVETIATMLAGAYRITAEGGCLVVDFPNKNRRKYSGNKTGWHAATSFTVKDFAAFAQTHGWSMQTYTGLLLFPVHRLPPTIRSLFFWTDTFLCNIFTKKYASYLLVKLYKK
jgi:ubiquinone/menaquinone biosynthesis C-methylase UbiE